MLAACGDSSWNNPYPPAERGAKTLYTAFSERPKHLDPARSYSSNEAVFTAQVYEPPLQYHFLQRPYQLIPLTATEVPTPHFYNSKGERLPRDARPQDIAYSVYDIHIQPGIRYQPHPAFAQDEQGRPLYQQLGPQDIAQVRKLSDFAKTGTRELTAADYVYQIKRLAHPKLHSPILGLMGDYIVGLKEYAATLGKAAKKQAAGNGYLDLDRYPLEGAQVLDRYTYRVKIRGKYPQFVYWLAMPFFGPVPAEAERFYSQTGLAERNITLDWYPVGTGPYMLAVNDPNQRMVLQRNPNFHGERYPSQGEPGDESAGLLGDAGKPLPLVDTVVFSLEKENVPYWNKFLQGYFDASGISSDSFDQAVQFGAGGEATLTDDMRTKGINLVTAVATSIHYMGFNMLDPVVGGNSERARKLRQAVSIAIDYEEYISIFRNGRGIPAQGPIPPGIFGYVEGKGGVDPAVYNWADGKAQRKPIEDARKLLAEAGYPNGVDEKNGKPLVLYFDTAASGPDSKALLDWHIKQLQKINIQLVIRSSDYNRFQDKMAKGSAQIFEWGWNADYPDPENFLFLLYGPNKKVGKEGENAANYENPEFDQLFEQMKDMDNGPARQAVIDRMLAIVWQDAPWVWGFHPKDFSLQHAWVYNVKPNLMANNTTKYRRVDPEQRAEKRREWNQPVLWPLALLLGGLVVAITPAVVAYRRREKAAVSPHPNLLPGGEGANDSTSGRRG